MSGKIPPLIAEICEAADVKIGGTHPWDFRIDNPNVFARVLYDGSLGLGDLMVIEDWHNFGHDYGLTL